MRYAFVFIISIGFLSCGKSKETIPSTPESIGTFSLKSATVDGADASATLHGISLQPIIKMSFSAPLKRSTAASILLNKSTGESISCNLYFQNNDSSVVLQPASVLSGSTAYKLLASSAVQSATGKALAGLVNILLITGIDTINKFPLITDNALLDKVQQQTLKYFVDFAHPVSGLARERNTSGDVVTTGGSGFGIMSIIVGITRNFITRGEGLSQLQKMVFFLQHNAQKFHGAFPHWLNGATGSVIPFSADDNGADLVETAYLMQGLLTARQFFNGADAAETSLRTDINTLWNGVEWDWFRKNNENVLYWHWSADKGWAVNVQIKGWNECLIAYVLAASSNTHTIPKIVYDNGWSSNGAFINNNIYFGLQLPLGPPRGGPLFFAHYSFLGVNPVGLSDAYANYLTQNTRHTLINYNYCAANPKGYYGYSSYCWGLTASDDNQEGYLAHEPDRDDGVISPTAALSSLPYTPAQSMNALRFFYYKLGDKLWGNYGFYDAFSLHDAWFADSYLAIDQGPIIVMIENYRNGLLWNLFTSCPEVKAGMLKLGFSAPYL